MQRIQAVSSGSRVCLRKARFVLYGQDRGTRLPGTGWKIGDRGPLFPLGHRLRIDAMALTQCPQALLIILYRSTDRLCRCGTPMQNLAYSASFHSGENIATLKLRIKHLRHTHSTSVNWTFHPVNPHALSILTRMLSVSPLIGTDASCEHMGSSIEPTRRVS